VLEDVGDGAGALVPMPRLRDGLPSARNALAISADEIDLLVSTLTNSIEEVLPSPASS